jgi:hypothetical protein
MSTPANAVLSTLLSLKTELQEGARKYYDLYHAVLRGRAIKENSKLRDYIASQIGQPLLPSPMFPDIRDDFQFFFGAGVEGLPLLRRIVNKLLRATVCTIDDPDWRNEEDVAVYNAQPRAAAAEGMLVILRNPTAAEKQKGATIVNCGRMPIPWHWVFGYDEVEHDWAEWMIELLREEDGPRRRPSFWHSEIEVLTVAEGRPACPPGDYLILPNGKPLGRWHDGGGKVVEDPQFREILKAVKDGKLGEITIFNEDIFDASVKALDVLVELLEPTGPQPPGTALKLDRIRLTKEGYVIGTLMDHPDWTPEQIARAVGCSRTSLYRMPAYMKAKDRRTNNCRDYWGVAT